jgi:hypothetical protein
LSERRSSKRVAAQLKVWCEGDGFTLLAEAVNVSKRGLFVRTSSPPPADSGFTVTIDELGTTADVELAWARPRSAQGLAGLGLRLGTFRRGGAAFERFVDKSASRSGEHHLVMPADEPEADGDPDGSGPASS